MELEGIIHTLKFWRHYLVGNNFLLLIENIGLKYMFERKTLNGHQARWIAFLSEYEFEIRHVN